MATGLSDERLRELIVEAYHDMHLPVPLGRIERTAQRRPRRRLVVLAAASAAAAVVVAVWALLPHNTGAALQPGDSPSTSASPAPEVPAGKPPRPTSSATTAVARCADYGLAELAATDSLPASDRQALPPLRFNLTLIDPQLSLLLYADERIEVTCWLTPDGASVSVNSSNLTTNRPAHPVGQLSNSASAHGQDPIAAYSFGRAPAGTTRVEVYFPDGGPVTAQLADGWYVAWATGEASHRFADITKVMAYTPEQTYTQAVEHG